MNLLNDKSSVKTQQRPRCGDRPSATPTTIYWSKNDSDGSATCSTSGSCQWGLDGSIVYPPILAMHRCASIHSDHRKHDDTCNTSNVHLINHSGVRIESFDACVLRNLSTCLTGEACEVEK